jgi:hypothetical protein
MQILSFVLFQLSWFAAILAGAHGLGWLGVVAILAHGAILAWRQPALLSEWPFWLATLAFGQVFDSLLALVGVFAFSHPWPIPWLSPPFMVGLWLNLALTLPFSLRWLKQRLVLGAIFGGIGGPLAYYAGHRLAAISLSPAVDRNLVLVGVAWAIAMPILLTLREVMSDNPAPATEKTP